MAESMRCCLGCGLGFFGPINWAYVLGEGRDTFGEGAILWYAHNSRQLNINWKMTAAMPPLPTSTLEACL